MSIRPGAAERRPIGSRIRYPDQGRRAAAVAGACSTGRCHPGSGRRGRGGDAAAPSRDACTGRTREGCRNRLCDRRPRAAQLGRLAGIGFVFQFHFLLPEFTIRETVEIPMLRLGRLSPPAIRRRAEDLLAQLGLPGTWPSGPTRSRAGSASGSRWPGPWPTTPDPGGRADRQPGPEKLGPGVRDPAIPVARRRQDGRRRHPRSDACRVDGPSA